jgi:ParB family chromosome partitioning protein
MISTDSIRRNPENPRVIFDPGKMEILKESINSVGILVPLIVYRDKKPDQYVLLDGERRWKCAQELNLPRVPANVITAPTRLENILRMFNIHNVREAWSITETAWKLQAIIALIVRETGKKPSEKILATLTGLPISGIARCKKLLSFPEKYQKMVHEGRVKSDFLIEMYPVLDGIKKKLPEIFRRKTKEGIIDHFLAMLEDKPSRLENVTDFRLLKRILESDKKGATTREIRDIVKRLFEDEKVTLPSLYNESVKSLYDSSSLEKKCIDMIKDLEPLDPHAVGKQTSLLGLLRRLKKTIDLVLEKAKEG